MVPGCYVVAAPLDFASMTEGDRRDRGGRGHGRLGRRRPPGRVRPSRAGPRSRPRLRLVRHAGVAQRSARRLHDPDEPRLGLPLGRRTRRPRPRVRTRSGHRGLFRPQRVHRLVGPSGSTTTAGRRGASTGGARTTSCRSSARRRCGCGFAGSATTRSCRSTARSSTPGSRWGCPSSTTWSRSTASRRSARSLPTARKASGGTPPSPTSIRCADRPDLEIRGDVTGRRASCSRATGRWASIWLDDGVTPGSVGRSGRAGRRDVRQPGAAAAQRRRSCRRPLGPGIPHRRRRGRGRSQPARPSQLRARLRADGRADGAGPRPSPPRASRCPTSRAFAKVRLVHVDRTACSTCTSSPRPRWTAGPRSSRPTSRRVPAGR